MIFSRISPLFYKYFLLFAIGISLLTNKLNAYDTGINPKLEIIKKEKKTFSTSQIVVDYTAHNRGNIQLAISNKGTFGNYGQSVPDPFTGENIPSCTYPKNSDLVYLWVGAIWIGAVVGRDTLVSTGTEDFYENEEFWPDVEPFKPSGGFTYKSLDPNSPFYDEEAYSEQDISCEYMDTLSDPSIVHWDDYDNRQHIPLGVKIYQRSMAWSFSYADDFILFDYQVENIGDKDLKNVYLGIYSDGDVWHTSNRDEVHWTDDMVGFYRTHPAPEGCGFIDTINIAYHYDNDGDPTNGAWDEKSPRGAVGARVVRTPAKELKYSYNWWITNYTSATLDFGPRKLDSPEDPYRNFGPRKGTPEGDKNKYYILRHEEFDYDLLYTNIDHTLEGYAPIPELAEDFADGFDVRYLLSFGPFDINPGQKLPISFAWVGGDNLHQNPNDYDDLFDSKKPNIFYEALNFDNLAANSRWASWVYDNPGVDTDGDGYFGKTRVCDLDSVIYKYDTLSLDPFILDTLWELTSAETTYYEGDNVPDFEGAGPPPAPKMRIMPKVGELTVRWNGYYSETTPDVFLNKIDFEGYRIYISRDDRPGSYSVLTSFDKEDYNRFVFKETTPGNFEWVLEDIPFTLDSLRIIFNDQSFDPLIYSRSNPLTYGSTNYFFEPQDYNISQLNTLDGIRKVFPDAVYPGTDRTQWKDEDLVYDYNEPLPKYYEYEYQIKDLLPTVPYYCAVTSFDFGSPKVGLPSLETTPGNNTVIEYPQYDAKQVENDNLDVYIYPNPYRIDQSYRDDGFEGRGILDRPDDRVRAIHFANLPHRCTIRIYSLDGDMIKEINHDVPQGDPRSAHDSWDLITRNTQAVVSGLYYWVVESDDRTQIGNVVIIK